MVLRMSERVAVTRQELERKIHDGEIDTVAGIECPESLAQLDGPQQAHVTISLVAHSRFATRDNAPTIPVGNSNISTTRTVPSSSCQYSVDATA